MEGEICFPRAFSRTYHRFPLLAPSLAFGNAILQQQQKLHTSGFRFRRMPPHYLLSAITCYMPQCHYLQRRATAHTLRCPSALQRTRCTVRKHLSSTRYSATYYKPPHLISFYGLQHDVGHATISLSSIEVMYLDLNTTRKISSYTLLFSEP